MPSQLRTPGQEVTVTYSRSLRSSLLRMGSAISEDTFWVTIGFVFCLAVSYTFGRNHILWEDEMLGWMLIHDPSWTHMIAAWKLGADGGGLAFYLLGRVWFAVFGASDASFRLYSAASFGVAFLVLWKAARQFYRIIPVACAMFIVWFLSPQMAVHMAEGRFYGLLVLGASIVIWLLLVKSQAGERGRVRTPVSLYLFTFLAHSLLTTSHTLGVLYSAVLLLALVALDVRAERLRVPLYLSAAASWTWLLLEQSAIRASVLVGQPWFWTKPPSLRRFLGAYMGYSNGIGVLLALLVILLVVSWRGRVGRVYARAAGWQPRRSVYVVVTALYLVPVGIAIGAQFGTSLFIERYLLPVDLALALLMMELLSLIEWSYFLPEGRWASISPRGRIVTLSSFATVLLGLVFFCVRPQVIQPLDYTDRLTARLPKGFPVVCEDAWSFTEIIGRQHSSGVLYTYLLDWPQSTSKAAPRLEVTQFHLMENWKKAGYFAGSIQSRDTFLQQNAAFLVLQRQVTPTDRDGRIIGNPLVERFARTPGYKVSLYRHGDTSETQDPNLWMICRGPCVL